MAKRKKNINKNSGFEARLRELNSKKPRSLDELAAEFGAVRQTVSKWMVGEAIPDIDQLQRMADFYEVSTDYLLGRCDTKNPDVNAQAAVEYTGLSEEAVEWLHIGLDDFECDGVGLAEEAKKENRDAASALIRSKAFTKMIHHLKEIAQEAYLERILKILYDDYSKCDLPEEDPNFRYANKEDRDVVVANYIHVLATKKPWDKENMSQKVTEMDDDTLSNDVAIAMFSAEDSNERNQFHAAKAFNRYIDQLVENSHKKAEQRFEP